MFTQYDAINHMEKQLKSAWHHSNVDLDSEMPDFSDEAEAKINGMSHVELIDLIGELMEAEENQESVQSSGEGWFKRRHAAFIDRLTIDLHSCDTNYAIPMLEAMLVRAELDGEFRKHFEQWIEHGSSVTLRDELCSPFKNADFVQEHGKKMLLRRS